MCAEWKGRRNFESIQYDKMNKWIKCTKFYVNANVNLMEENVTQNKNEIMISVNLSVKNKNNKKSIKHRVFEVDYAWKPNICACECDKDCKVT